MAVKQTSIQIGKNDYLVKYPNTGQQIDIEVRKFQLSANRYEDLKMSYLTSAQKQALNIEAAATFMVLIPEMLKDLTVKNLMELSQEEYDVVLLAYVEQFLPWYTEINEALSNPKKDEPTANVATGA